LFATHRRQSPGTLSARQLRVALTGAQPPLVLDVRNADEYVGDLGYIEGSVPIPLPDLEKRLDELAPHRERRIVAV
jgi:rhodanese-related sulfurtransferase